jgi:AraC-like DNA-binding protein
MMEFEEILLYDKGYSILINNESYPFYYYFDYDERYYDINMEFQHFHQFYEIFILCDEKAVHIVEGDYYALEKFDIVLLRPALLHKTEYPAGPPRKRLIIQFSVPLPVPGLDRALSAVLSVFNEDIPIFRFPDPVRNRIFVPLNDVFTLGKQHWPQLEMIVHSKFQEFLWLLFAHRKDNLYKPEHLTDSITHKVFAITSFIHRNYRHPLSLDNLADRFSISLYYLSHQFKRITGFTLVNYIQMTRIRNAQELLLYTDLKLKDIVRRCGFTSLSQFNRVFNKICESSPSEYRRGGRVRPDILANDLLAPLRNHDSQDFI